MPRHCGDVSVADVSDFSDLREDLWLGSMAGEAQSMFDGLLPACSRRRCAWQRYRNGTARGGSWAVSFAEEVAVRALSRHLRLQLGSMCEGDKLCWCLVPVLPGPGSVCIGGLLSLSSGASGSRSMLGNSDEVRLLMLWCLEDRHGRGADS
jgi:hypothetical protein